MNIDAWRARPMTVRTLELCERCNKLAEAVEKREHKSYWPTYSLEIRSCMPCFETAKREAAAEYNVTMC